MDQTKDQNQETDNRSWLETPLPSYEAVALTPRTGPDFSGIKIWAPDVIYLKSTKKFPLFGVVQFKEAELIEMGISDRHPLRAVVVGAIVAGVHVPSVGNALLQAPLFPSLTSHDPVTEYFNIDIVESTRMLRSPGNYFLFASIGTYVAEPLSITVLP